MLSVLILHSFSKSYVRKKKYCKIKKKMGKKGQEGSSFGYLRGIRKVMQMKNVFFALFAVRLQLNSGALYALLGINLD